MNTGGMKRGRVRLAAGALALVMVATTAMAAPASAASNTLIQRQVDYILSSQAADGAIQMTPTLKHVNPYFANTAAEGLIAARLLDGRPGKALQIENAVARWVTWYMQHLNPAGVGVTLLPFSISDYTWNGSSWQQDTNSGHKTKYGDSVDSYASTALNLANAAWFSGSARLRTLVKQNLTTYEHIANTIVYPAPNGVRQANGLTAALPIPSGQYTMDNAEVYSGLADFSAIMSDRTINQPSKASYYSGFANWTTAAINDQLWDKTSGLYRVASGELSHLWGFYPDGMAQLFPAMFDVPEAWPASQGTALWTKFKQSFPNWSTAAALDPSGFPQLLVARAAANFGAYQDARTYLNAIDQAYTANGGWNPGAGKGGYWHVAESGNYLIVAKDLAARGL